MQAVDLAQRGQVDVEPLPVVVGTEVGQPGLGRGFGVQRVGVQRAVRRHRRHHVADLLDLGAEARLGEVVEVDGAGAASVTATYVTLSFVMTTELGRPRDKRIDSAVLRATVELLAETGYADSLGRRDRTAGRHQQTGDLPALAQQGAPGARGGLPDQRRHRAPGHRIAGRGRARDGRRTAAVLTTPAARAALPGLVGEMAADLTLHSALLERFGDILSRGLTDRLADAVERGEVRPDVTAAEMVEAVAGTTFLALLTRGNALDDSWIDRTAALITRGISA